jgi:hypothetical protein
MGDAKTVRPDLPSGTQAIPVQQLPKTALPTTAGPAAAWAGARGGLGNAATAALLQRIPPSAGAAGAAGLIDRGGPGLGPQVTSATSLPAAPSAATGARSSLAAGGAQPRPSAQPSVSKDDIKQMIAEEDLAAIRRLTDADLTVTTPQQRAGLIRILADLTWTARPDEAIIVRLLRSGGKNADVTRTLDALGYRQKVLNSVDDPALHAEATQLLGAAAAPAQGLIGKALASQRPRDVMAIVDFATATNDQRLGLLRILLDMRWSNSVEEAKMLDILQSAGSGLGPLVSDLRSTGLIKALFDHIDDAQNKARLTHLLEPLNDVEIERDLLVFNMSRVERIRVGVGGGIVSAWKEFSFSKLFRGLAQPIIHPIDTLDGYLDQLLDLVKAPSLNRLVTLARDVVGFIAQWLGLLALIVGGLALLFGATIILIPGAVPLGVIAASLAADAAFFGILFLVLSGLKLLLNIWEAGEATTYQELEKQQRQVGEGVTVLTIAAMTAGLARGFKTVLGKIRGSATVPDQADPDVLKDTASEADKTSQQATAAGDELKQKAGPAQQAGAEQQAGGPKVVRPGEAEQKGPAKQKGPPKPRVPYRPCFLAGTEVEVGGYPKPIETVAVGDKVLGSDPRPALAPGLHRVVALHRASTRCVTRVDVGSASIHSTRAHLFHVPDRGWVRAAELRPGDVLSEAGGATIRVSAVERVVLADDAATFDLTVEGVSTYFIRAADHWVLVHNGGPDDFDGPLYWFFGKTPNLRPGDVDGLSTWKTSSRADVNTLMDHRVNVVGRKIGDQNGYFTEEQIKEAGLAAPPTPSKDPLASKLPHHSLRPAAAQKYPADLNDKEMNQLAETLKTMPNPVVKPSDLEC